VSLVVGWLLPFLGLAALLGLPALWLWRRRRAAPAGTDAG
jgi:LPXTG-motif cell wall-anchored protein